MEELLRIDAKAWLAEGPQLTEFYSKFGDRFPAELRRQHEEQQRRLAEAAR
jgi:phosphoenolpyruvate carboxykinase (GTP)